MRSLALLSLLAAVSLPGAASAEVRVSVDTDTYAISGDSGAALMRAMDRKGPRHGFLTRAIAQTRYTVNWKIEWSKAGRSCRLKQADAHLDIGYRYPQLAHAVSPALRRKWTRFIAGVRKHEEMHGRIARDMVRAAHRSLQGVGYADDPGCRKAQKEVARIVDATYADYEARQRAFDAREHSPGGKVDGLVGALISRK